MAVTEGSGSGTQELGATARRPSPDGRARAVAGSVEPDPIRWAVEAFGVRKRFVSRQGLPVDWGFGPAHWIISTIIKYRKKREWHQAVAGVDLKVRRGEVFGLLGPNGAGKTTLLKCLATLLEVDAGEAFVNGYSIRTQPNEVRLSMNLVGSGHWAAFDWQMTVVQNLHFFGALYGLSHAERRERIAHSLERLGLRHLADATPRTLSAGERQRLLLAKGFMIRMPVFFLDEPTVGLDPDGARSVREFIRDELIGTSGTSAILTTHRLGEAEALCARLAIMDRGRIVALGTPRELKALAGQNAVVEVRTLAIPAVALAAIRALPGVKTALVAPVGGQSLEESLRVHCDDAEIGGGDPIATRDRVVALLEAHGARIGGVEIQEPTLEDAFIALTERRLE